ncbi:hypothetical protein [Streptomyces albidus (ex Kaewkla and Franco 2022)]|uniref:hypothetical protein n=1 Tax=Streptomyces albidus (ex Kaewkla and Franco 2022) TaxID=722709 RepID=UPI0015EF59A6|nr:hypothetical protein [Streptomyces albidus (ex Kaewkla and Franco 2022)]
MSYAEVLPLVLVFGIITVILVRSREVSWWAAIFIFLFGVYTALTPAVFMVTNLVQWLASRFAG